MFLFFHEFTFLSFNKLPLSTELRQKKSAVFSFYFSCVKLIDSVIFMYE